MPSRLRDSVDPFGSLAELEVQPPTIEFDPTPVRRPRTGRSGLIVLAFLGLLGGAVAVGRSGQGTADASRSHDGRAAVAVGAGPAAAGTGAGSAAPGAAAPNVAPPRIAGQITLKVLPTASRVSIIGDIAAEGVDAVIVSIEDAAGTVIDQQSLSVRHLGGGFRPDRWPAFAVTLRSRGPNAIQLVEATAYDAAGHELASGRRVFGIGLQAIVIPRMVIVRD